MQADARSQLLRRRQAEVSKHRELGAVAQTKRLELVLAERYRREAQLAHFIRTSGRAPPLHWLPAKHSDETLQLLQKEQGRLEAWKVRNQWCSDRDCRHRMSHDKPVVRVL